jgi:hypothetical protein
VETRRRASTGGGRHSGSTASGRAQRSSGLSDLDERGSASAAVTSPSGREHELEFNPSNTSIYSACDEICSNLLQDCGDSPDFNPLEPLPNHVELRPRALNAAQKPVAMRRAALARARDVTVVKRIKTVRGGSTATRYALYARQDLPRGRYVCEFVGEVFPAKMYIDDPMNQYKLLGTVKSHVRLHPAAPLCVDARHVGNDARFFRRHCQPNCVVRTVVLADTDEDEDPKTAVRLCAFAARDIGRGEELTLPWEFYADHICSRAVPDPAEIEQNETDAQHETRAIVYTAVLAMADCACEKSSMCQFEKMRRWLEAYRRGATALKVDNNVVNRPKSRRSTKATLGMTMEHGASGKS